LNAYITLLRDNRNYRNLWLARVVSNLGDWFNLLASATLIAQLTDTGTAISFLFLVRFLPLFLMSPFAGVIADRFDRRTILLVTNVARAAVVLSFLFVDRPERIWLLYVLTALQFVFSAIFTPAETALIPSVVDERDLVTANALDSLTWSTMLAFGSMLGGLATAAFGVTTAFVLDALTFLLAAWFVTRVRAPARAPRARVTFRQDVRTGMTAFVEGLRFLGGRPFLLGVALVKAGGALVWGAVNVLEVPLGQDVFPINDNGALTLGLIYACVGIGTGFGPLILRARLGDSRPGMLRAITIGFVAMTIGTFGLALAPAIGWVLAATVVRGLGTGAIWVFSTVLLQLTLPDGVRGRVFASEFALLTLTQSLSTLWAGFAADTLGWSISGILASTGFASIAVTLLWLFFVTRQAAAQASKPVRG
jgi:MFS family permease